jgi:hypothetical protein
MLEPNFPGKGTKPPIMLSMRTLPAYLRFASLAALIFAGSAVAQSPASTQAAPVPPAITLAKTIFVSNAGANSGLFPDPFSGDPSRPYMEF